MLPVRLWWSEWSALSHGVMMTSRPICCSGPCLALWPYCNQDHFYVQCLCCHQRPHRSPGSQRLPIAYGYPRTCCCQTMLIWVACPATQGHGSIQDWASAEGDVWVHSLLKLGSMLMSVACIVTGSLRNHVWWNQRVGSVSLSPYESRLVDSVSPLVMSLWCLWFLHSFPSSSAVIPEL